MLKIQDPSLDTIFVISYFLKNNFQGVTQILVQKLVLVQYTITNKTLKRLILSGLITYQNSELIVFMQQLSRHIYLKNISDGCIY